MLSDEKKAQSTKREIERTRRSKKRMDRISTKSTTNKNKRILRKRERDNNNNKQKQ